MSTLESTIEQKEFKKAQFTKPLNKIQNKSNFVSSSSFNLSKPILGKNDNSKFGKSFSSGKKPFSNKVSGKSSTFQKYQKDKGKDKFPRITKTKQDEIYFRQRSLKINNPKDILIQKKQKQKQVKRSLRFIFFLKQEQKKRILLRQEMINYKDIKFLKVFLTKFGKIRSRRTTRLKIFQQAIISKLIRKARSFNLIPSKFIVVS